ncbi:hypothetical protein AAMO2058_000818600 [Amorphochlora amoebiformis]|uniref:HNH domain-containing protein n=1 Tax=Amorphochlora amoebiformis TaxID=1561963 RepID=A0A7S0GSK4_9EUKA|mmetsp:Transcript_16001/g.25340  ORF Transcript_16001/g.25340 Transcript_16001/m.25340 type:complete len:227 (+) Transcript_16001:106-786(+)
MRYVLFTCLLSVFLFSMYTFWPVPSGSSPRLSSSGLASGSTTLSPRLSSHRDKSSILGCQAQKYSRVARSKLSNSVRRNIKHPDNILRAHTAEMAALGNRIGLDKARAMNTDFCKLCETSEGEMTFHHLIPRATHSKRWCQLRFTREERASGVCLCRQCHDEVHKRIDERSLAMQYNSIQDLSNHPDLRSFVDAKAPWTWLANPLDRNIESDHREKAVRKHSKRRA